MISAHQIRADRALPGWSQQDLTDRAMVSVTALRRLEGDRLSTVAAVKSALESAGIAFLPADGRQGEGVRLRSP